MKSRIIVMLCALLSSFALFAQKDTTDAKTSKTENEKKIDESIAKIKKEIETIKKNIDTAKLREIAKELGKNADEIGEALEDIADELEEKADEAEEKTEKRFENMTIPKDRSEKIKSSGRVTRRTKMYLDFGIGLTGLVNNSPENAGAVFPEYKTWGSRYWEIGLKFKTRLGGANSRAAVTYGLSYWLNSFEADNNVKISYENSVPKFERVSNAVGSTELNVGYLTIPIGLEFKVGRKGKIGVGGFGGYRIRTVQHIDLKTDTESIEESRRASYGLNNLTYGLSAKLGVGGIVLNGRYALSNIFKEDNKAYQMGVYNIGLIFSF
jgi:hypothetical protein